MSARASDLLSMNRSCGCLPLDAQQIRRDLVQQRPDLGLAPLLAERGDLFARSGVFVSPADVEQMAAVVNAIEATAQLPMYRQTLALRHGELASRLDTTTRGMFMGYDFHLTAQGPKLIEVNTNAGGAGLVAAMQASTGMHDAQCLGARLRTLVPNFAVAVADMVKAEWQRGGGEGAPRYIAIVDAAPEQEYLYPDMLLLQALLQEQGLNSRIVAATDLVWDGKALTAGGQSIDLVYNRLTDFGLTHEHSAALRSAWLQQAVVVSPAPEHHALFADKRNLAMYSDPEHPALAGLSAVNKAALQQVPKTRLLESSNAEALWQERKGLFFKPVAGFAGRGAYRGNKLTKRVWRELQHQPYVAQRLVPPAQRLLPMLATDTGEPGQLLKFDVRLYTYAGKPLLLAARAYQGQTTNFRTPGGGFAPVFGCQ